MAETTMVTYSIKIPQEMYDDLSTMAEDNERNMSQEGRQALKTHIAKHKRKKELAARKN